MTRESLTHFSKIWNCYSHLKTWVSHSLIQFVSAKKADLRAWVETFGKTISMIICDLFIDSSICMNNWTVLNNIETFPINIFPFLRVFARVGNFLFVYLGSKLCFRSFWLSISHFILNMNDLRQELFNEIDDYLMEFGGGGGRVLPTWDEANPLRRNRYMERQLFTQFWFYSDEILELMSLMTDDLQPAYLNHQIDATPLKQV